ncbi:TVP38/TMEM64 family protein [Lacticaseibacillus sp. GG6-2]
MEARTSRKLINWTTIATLGASAAVIAYWYHLGVFHNLASLQAYLAQTGVLGPLLFITIQIIQVVIPIIPGGVSTAAGVVLFGPWAGFAYNYVGIGIGSLINFWLARHYGQTFIYHVVSKHVCNKYLAYTKNQRRFDWFFTIAIIAPVAPDDVLCLIAGLTKMSFKKFFWIIILCKPITIAVYSGALVAGTHWLAQFF